MGTYVYSLRKKHIEANLGCAPVNVVSFEYAYKESFARQGEYGYSAIQRLAGRAHSLAAQARDYFMQDSPADRTFYFAMGGLTDGALVYSMVGTLPVTAYDDNLASRSNVTSVGRLYKLGRGKWTVSEVCPEHNYEEFTAMDDTPVYQCQRCDTITEEKPQ